MTKNGLVLEKDKNVAKIKIERDSACGENCAACGLCPNRSLVVLVPVPDHIHIGDTVRLVSEGKGILGSSAACYIGFTALLFLGAALGYVFGGQWTAFALSIAFPLTGAFFMRFIKPPKIHVEKL